MLKYHIITYGCQMNTSDSERIATLLEDKGYKHSTTPDGADLVIISVCSVKQKPIDRIKNQIITIKREKKNPRVVLTGCILPKDKEMFKKLGAEIKDYKEIENIMPKVAFIPITRGCNNFCTYCAVPYTKGREKHRKEQKILSEAKQLISKGHKKIMLLGQNVNSYPNFVGLLKKITALKGNFTIEFISNHPKDFSDELITEMATNPKLEKYVHLPYQSGDNKILKRMNRKYTRQQYLKLVNKIKTAIPDIRITTDAIVGFPGETEEQFQNTVNVAKEIGFLQIYISKYSPRNGTPAAMMKDNISLEEKKLREQTLRKLIKENRSFHNDRNEMNKKKLVVILGPTASGKTSLSIKLAKKFNGEVVSADSRQVYKKMNIGSGKITKKEMLGIPHHLLDVIRPKTKFSVAQYQKKAIKAINEISKKEKLPFLVGGSPFYIYSVVDGWQFPEMKADHILRKKLEKKPLEELQKMLKKLDAKRYATIETKNKRRLTRAIEIAKTLGKVPKLEQNPQFDCLLLGIKHSKEKSAELIHKRQIKMFKQGMINEVKLLKKSGVSWKRLDDFGLEYRWISRYLQNKITKQEMEEKLETDTIKFSKRQMTWFKRNKKILWIENQKQTEQAIKKFLN